MLKIGIILGTRPEIIKFYSIIHELVSRKVNFFIIHTNQHYYANMDRMFFQELSLPNPKYNLGINSDYYHGKMVGKMLIKIEQILIKEKPTWVIVQGDTNSALAGALATSKLKIKLGHVEAGLRSYDMEMPEEINRILIDRISNALFCPTENQRKILINEGMEENKIFITGNTIVDVLYQNIQKALHDKNKLYDQPYMLLTLHRPSNVDNQKIFRQLVKSLENVADRFNQYIIFPTHPRSAKQMKKFKISVDTNKIKIISPLGYLSMINLEKRASLIITDSGGLQEEACILGVPCLTIRNNTERPETLEIGSNLLVGNKPKTILSGATRMLNNQTNWQHPYGDGNVGKRIVDYLVPDIPNSRLRY